MPARITDTTFQALVGKIYDAACDPALWPELLRAMARAIEGRGTLIFQHDFETREGSMMPEASPINVPIDLDSAFLRSYDEYYGRVNVWGMNEPELRTGRAVTGSMLFPVRDLPKTEFYNDWLRPQGFFHLIGGVIIREGSWSIHFSSARSRCAGDFSPEQVRLYQELVPHLARAVQIHRKFAFLQNLSTSSLAVLDAVPAAVMLLDSTARVLHGNAAADAELRRGDPFRLGPCGQMSIRGTASARAAVRSAIGAALDPAGSIKGWRPMIAQVSRRNGDVLSIQALPLAQGQRAAPGTRIQQRIAACALVIHGPARVPAVGPELLRHVYGLTPAEVQVALAMAEGETLGSYAERRGISRNTAASQLKRAFDKTGLRRQSELVRFLLLCGATLQPQRQDT